MRAISDAWYYSDLAYYYPNGTEALLDDGGFIPLWGKPDFAYLYLDHKNKKAWFVGQGTDNLKEWLKNIRCLREVEGKFVAWYDDFRKYFQTKLASFFEDFPTYQWFCTGHSRGGAFAGNAAAFLASEYGKQIRCITFGEPAWLTAEGKEHVESLPIDYTWVVNGWDAVTNAPPFGHHAGKPLYLPQPPWHKLAYFRVKDHTTYDRNLRNYLRKNRA